MATNINTILSWFMTGKKPTQAQFWSTLGSFWHKDETIPQNSISNLTTVLNAKVEKTQFDAQGKILQTQIDDLTEGKEDKANKNAPNGYAALDSGGKVSSAQLPSYVDDILEGYLQSNVFYLESSHVTVISAETGKIYVDITTGQKNKQYRYSGTTYIQITNGLIASTDDVPEGAVNKYSTLSLVMSYVLTGISFATGTPITATDTILSAFGKLQKQITDNVSALALKQVKDDQIEIANSGNVQNYWHGQTVIFTANCTITVPATLNGSLMFPFRTLAGVTVTWAITSPFVWESTPIATAEKTVGHFMRRGSTNTIFLDV